MKQQNLVKGDEGILRAVSWISHDEFTYVVDFKGLTGVEISSKMAQIVA